MGETPTKIAIHFALESTPCQVFRSISKMMSAPVWAAILASTFRSSCLLKPWSSSGASRFRIPQRSIFAFPLILTSPLTICHIKTAVIEHGDRSRHSSLAAQSRYQNPNYSNMKNGPYRAAPVCFIPYWLYSTLLPEPWAAELTCGWRRSPGIAPLRGSLRVAPIACVCGWAKSTGWWHHRKRACHSSFWIGGNRSLPCLAVFDVGSSHTGRSSRTFRIAAPSRQGSTSRRY